MTNLEQRSAPSPTIPGSTETGRSAPAAAQELSGRPDIEITVPGEPKGKARPRFNRQTGQVFTPTASMRAEHRIQIEWIAIGRPTVQGPLRIEIEMILQRPKGHFRTNGELSTAGLRLPWPVKKPDWDNVAKLVGDSLNTLAYRDDAQIVDARTIKRWAQSGQQECTRIRIWELEDE